MTCQKTSSVPESSRMVQEQDESLHYFVFQGNLRFQDIPNDSEMFILPGSAPDVYFQ